MARRSGPALNREQARVVRMTQGPILVLAGAGTGKTHTITARIARLVGQGAAPAGLLAVTFTNKAAREMKERVRALVPRSVSLDEMFVGTFHAFCARLLRRHAKTLGYGTSFSIADAAEQVSLVRQALRHIRGAPKARPNALLQSISRLKIRGVSPRTFARQAVEPWEQTLASVYTRYEEALLRTHAMDFDDLLLKAVELLEGHKRIRWQWQKRLRHILVDEFQDTSEIQCRLVELLAEDAESLCAVGDDDQSIYAWRGAVPGNLLAFDKRFPGASVVRLEENYRSVETILKAANALIERNEQRHAKALWSRLGEGRRIRVHMAQDQDEEAERIVAEIQGRLSRKDGAPASYAIIVRTNAQTRPFEQELRAARIPYVVIGGTSFFDRKETRDVLAYLTILANPRADSALLRIVNTPARGIGDRTLEALRAHAAQGAIPLLTAFGRAGDVEGLSGQAREACQAFAAQIAAWQRKARGRGLCRLVETILTDTEYAQEVQRLYDDPLEQAARLNMAEEVGEALQSFLEKNKGAGLAGFLQEATLWGKESQSEKERNTAGRSLKLITVHSAKGLEFDRVVVAGLEEELLPHKNAVEADDVEEERRLCYVAVTRARRELVLSHCRTRTHRGKRIPRQPSRFLGEIPDELLDRQDRELSNEDLKSFASSMVERLSGGA